VFRANAIEADVLHDLTDHLEKAWGVARPSPQTVAGNSRTRPAFSKFESYQAALSSL